MKTIKPIALLLTLALAGCTHPGRQVHADEQLNVYINGQVRTVEKTTVSAAARAYIESKVREMDEATRTTPPGH